MPDAKEKEDLEELEELAMIYLLKPFVVNDQICVIDLEKKSSAS